MASNSFGRSKNANNIINKYPTKPNKPTGIPKNNEMGPDATASQFTLEEILQIEFKGLLKYRYKRYNAKITPKPDKTLIML